MGGVARLKEWNRLNSASLGWFAGAGTPQTAPPQDAVRGLWKAKLRVRSPGVGDPLGIRTS